MYNFKNITLPGYRTLKTAIAATICLFVYSLMGRDGAVLAATAAIICMQDSVEKSITAGKNRVKGTLLGGIFASAIIVSGLLEYSYVSYLACCFLGLTFLIYIANILNIKQSIVISCIVFIIILTDASKAASPLYYSINRTIDTIIGIIISVLLNTLLFRPSERTEAAYKMFSYKVIRKGDVAEAKWKGGSTYELFISPEESHYQDRDFDFRVSTAIVELSRSDFTRLSGFDRYIMLIDGEMQLSHEGQRTVALEKYGIDYFKGEWHTESYGKCRDLNLMLREGLTGGLEPVKSGFEGEYAGKDHLSFFILTDNVEIKIKSENKDYTEVLNQYDYIILGNMENQTAGYKITVPSASGDCTEPVAVKITAKQD
ncbi:HutD family protein [Anaeropeptidivorans aminofermentans]|uniref:HutD family protein n=1 Tax=Anaeropeptidivorans aminofermentans TaxID=2934315 RepID=UPI00202538B7|nr:HutD family protein [Anaeropeptidivorans aminofermentans]MBE6011734.1 hypothetical protein [Lachnospiraceae bacterium]